MLRYIRRAPTTSVRVALQRRLAHSATNFEPRYAQIPENDAVSFVHGRRLHWICREGTWPVIIDARPEADHKVYNIFGAISFPFDTATQQEIDSLPKSREIYLHAGDQGEYENEVIDFAIKIKKSHPSVFVVQGGPTEIRRGGFIYNCDFPQLEAREAQKKREKEEAVKAAAAKAAAAQAKA